MVGIELSHVLTLWPLDYCSSIFIYRTNLLKPYRFSLLIILDYGAVAQRRDVLKFTQVYLEPTSIVLRRLSLGDVNDCLTIKMIEIVKCPMYMVFETTAREQVLRVIVRNFSVRESFSNNSIVVIVELTSEALV